MIDRLKNKPMMNSRTLQKTKLPKGWREARLGDLGDFSKGSGITKNEIVESGVPCILYGELYTKHNLTIKKFHSFIKDKDLNKYVLIKDNSVLFSGSGETREEIGKCASFNYDIKVCAGGDVIIFSIEPEKLDAKFASFYLNTEGRKQINRLGQGNSIVHIYSRFLQTVKIPLPPLPEQKAIASLLEEWDMAIEKTEALIAANQKQFEWLVTSLINKSECAKNRLLDFIKEVSKLNRNNKISRVLSVTNHSGFILPKDQFERRIASINISNYKVVARGQYAYNPARINVGSIARLDNYDNGVLSPMYIAFELNTKKIESDYFLHWLSSNEAKQRIKNSTQGSVRQSVSFDNLGTIPIRLPNLKKQRATIKILNTARQEIILLQQLIKQYKQQKKGLMQKLLTGKWRIR